MRENVEPGTQNIIGFIRVMAFINYLSEHPELKEMENKADVGKSRKRFPRISNRPGNPHVSFRLTASGSFPQMKN